MQQEEGNDARIDSAKASSFGPYEDLKNFDGHESYHSEEERSFLREQLHHGDLRIRNNDIPRVVSTSNICF